MAMIGVYNYPEQLVTCYTREGSMAKKIRKTNSDHVSAVGMRDGILSDPRAAADQIDAILYFLHKRYEGAGVTNELPTMHTFLIQRMDVVFTGDVQQIVIEKSPAKNALTILTPSVPKDQEEARRVYLLNAFADLLIKTQRQGYQQLREMLLAILDESGQAILINEYQKFKKQRQERQA